MHILPGIIPDMLEVAEVDRVFVALGAAQAGTQGDPDQAAQSASSGVLAAASQVLAHTRLNRN